MNREDLVILVKRILSGDDKKEEIAELIELLNKNVPHPAVSDLIYYDDLSPEEIVDKALSYKPIIL